MNFESIGVQSDAMNISNPRLIGRTHEFGFLRGDWQVMNRRLRERLTGCTAWDEFPATLRGQTGRRTGGRPTGSTAATAGCSHRCTAASMSVTAASSTVMTPTRAAP